MSELAFLSGFNPWGVGDSVNFQERFPAPPKSEMITPRASSIIQFKDLRNLNLRNLRHARCCRESRIPCFPANLVLLWRGKLVWKNQSQPLGLADSLK